MRVIFCSYLQAKLNALIESLQADLKKVSTSDIEIVSFYILHVIYLG